MKFRFIHVNAYNRPLYVNKHVHSVYELVYYISGQGVSHYGQGAALIDKGPDIVYVNNMSNPSSFYFGNNRFILYPPGVVHDEEHMAPCRLIAVGFEENDFPFDPVAREFSDYDLSVLRYMEKISEEFKGRGYLYHKAIEATLTELFVSVYRARGRTEPVGFDPVEYAVIYLNEHFTTDVDLDSLAASANYSPSRFRSLFKERTGISPKGYILEKRIAYAKKLLTETKLSIREIALMTGFTDYPQFNKFFNRKEGINPKCFRGKE